MSKIEFKMVLGMLFRSAVAVASESNLSLSFTLGLDIMYPYSLLD